MQNEKITIEVIETKEFHVAARGYNQREVDEFLDSICDELESMEAEMASLEATINRLQNQAIPQPVMHQAYQAPQPVPVAPATAESDGTFREILEMAQRVKEQTIADAEAQAKAVTEAAEKAAVEMKAETERLRAIADAYRTNFKQLVEEQMKALNASEALLK